MCGGGWLQLDWLFLLFDCFAHRFGKLHQVIGIGVGQGLVEVLDHGIDIGHVIGLFLHLHVALAHGKRHFALAHIGPDNGVAVVDERLRFVQNRLEIRLAAAESGGAEQKDLPVAWSATPWFVQKPTNSVSDAGIALLVRPQPAPA